MIRAARSDDGAFVTSLVPRLVETGLPGGHSRAEVIEGTARVLRAALAQPQPADLFLIAEDAHGERAGFVYAVTQRDFFSGEAYAHISEIVAARSGAGIGEALMAAAEAWARERGYRMVTLNVVEENRAARRFYERLAYGPHHRQLIKSLR